jgi:ethanolamine-phosphate cytidylyltransferase
MAEAGHIAALQEARRYGDFLLVGVHDDATVSYIHFVKMQSCNLHLQVNGLRHHGLPILNLYERTLSLLSCKYVDEVIIGKYMTLWNTCVIGFYEPQALHGLLLRR